MYISHDASPPFFECQSDTLLLIEGDQHVELYVHTYKQYSHVHRFITLCLPSLFKRQSDTNSISIRICIYTCIHVYIHIYICNTYIHVYTCKKMYTLHMTYYLVICIYTCIHVYIHVYIYKKGIRYI